MIKNLKNLYDLQSEIAGLQEIIRSQKTVVHACGEYNGLNYTNSYEALVNSYQNGNRIIEIDFNLTSDNRLILGHENGSEQWVSGINSAEPLTEEEFKSRKYMDQLTTMSLDDLAGFMREHEDLYVITDIKGRDLGNAEGCAIIASMYPDLTDRFIIQIYHINEYGTVRALGFRNVIFTLYATSENERLTEVILQNLNDCDLLGLTFWDYWSEEDYVLQTQQTGALTFAHTVNDRTAISSYTDRGILVYTDNTDNDWLR